MSILPKKRRAVGYVKGNALSFSNETRARFPFMERDPDTGRAHLKVLEETLEDLKHRCNVNGIPIHPSDRVQALHPVFIDYGILPYHYGVYVHPTDYYWLKHDDDPDLAHDMVMAWIDMRIESMGNAAIKRIDQMHRDKD
jgi:hypothetical protein